MQSFVYWFLSTCKLDFQYFERVENEFIEETIWRTGVDMSLKQENR